MADQSGKPTHTVMKHSLAKALIESGMEHFSGGGIMGAIGGILGMGKSDYNGGPAQNIYKQNFTPQIAGLQDQENAVYNQQQALANALLAQSQGQGPNPVQAQLAQNTGQNMAGQAALMASQRGASANPAAIARLAAMQGANMQQQATGQAATLGAQQQLAAQQALQQQQNNIGGLALNREQLQQQSLAQQNSAVNQGNATNAQVASQNASSKNQMLGSLLQAGGTIVGGIYGGPAGAALGNAAGSAIGGALEGGSGDSTTGGGASPQAVWKGGAIKPMLDGGPVPGKAPVAGDNEKNDIEPALLSPGEVVLPRSVTQSPDAVKKAAEFMAHLQATKPQKKGYGGVIESKKTLEDRVKHLEKLCMGGRMK